MDVGFFGKADDTAEQFCAEVIRMRRADFSTGVRLLEPGMSF